MWVYNWDMTAIINLDRVDEIRISSDFEKKSWYITAGGHYLVRDLSSESEAAAVLERLYDRLEGRA